MKIHLTENAQKTLLAEERLPLGSSDGFWYDITKGGYFNPEDVMADTKQIVEMKNAIKLVQQLEEIYDKLAREF